MCRDWLCGLGNNGFCYFRIDPNSIPRRSRDLTEEDWDALDRMHDVLDAPLLQPVAAKLGIAIHSLGEEATAADKQLGERRFEEMKQRYCDRAPRAARKATLFRGESAAEAAAKVRLLGEEFAVALRNALG